MIKPKDADELQRFSELLDLCVRQVERFGETEPRPVRPEAGSTEGEWRKYDSALERYYGVLHGLCLAEFRLQQVQSAMYAALRQPTAGDLGMEAGS
jgi:hypothetical protein